MKGWKRKEMKSCGGCREEEKEGRRCYVCRKAVQPFCLDISPSSTPLYDLLQARNF